MGQPSQPQCGRDRFAISNLPNQTRRLYGLNTEGEAVLKAVENINAYLVAAPNVEVVAQSKCPDERATMQFGNHPYYGSALIFSQDEGRQIIAQYPEHKEFVRPLYGSKEFISSAPRSCIWIEEQSLTKAVENPEILERIEKVKASRLGAKRDNAAQKLATTPYRFREQNTAQDHVMVVPRNRAYLPVGILSSDSIIQEKAFALYDAPLWNMALIASRLHWVWIGTVCVRMRTDFSYSNTLGWNTFPVPKLTEKNKEDLTRCAEDILLAREAHFPATIADLYKPDAMPENLRAAHDRNDEEATMSSKKSVPSVSVTYAQNRSSTTSNELGMRKMQERAYEMRGEQYLLIKSPPASGKSRALMFIALDKLHNQNLKQAIVVVPEKSIGSSFNDEPLSKFGFWADWHVEPQWNLCNAPGGDDGKVGAVGRFLESDDQVLVCTTFRFAVDKFGIEAFDDRVIAVDEFHHVSANPDNKLGAHLGAFIARDKVHLVAMTGSYFRGDAEAVLSPEDEARFETVTYTYYEQLNGYEHLKTLDIGYFFYTGSYADSILEVLDPTEKTILGGVEGARSRDRFPIGRNARGPLRIADLVDDEAAKRDKVASALKDPAHKNNRDRVDIIIALGMAKEGFDWIWCEHALTVGYRASLTEIVQIIGRATRDAEGKTKARFTNLIAEPDAGEEAVTEAVNDTLKAIAASLLMEQVLAPRFNFTPKTQTSGPVEGFDYGEGGYDPNKENVGFDAATGQVQMEINLLNPRANSRDEFVMKI
ncbi:putative ATP-dependent helicase YeeB [Nymphon striatum]|nr:putative ATP-dependent helicase YeeB [Nymphon striatum]